MDDNQLPSLPFSITPSIRFLVNLTSYFIEQGIIQTFHQVGMLNVPCTKAAQNISMILI